MQTIRTARVHCFVFRRRGGKETRLLQWNTTIYVVAELRTFHAKRKSYKSSVNYVTHHQRLWLRRRIAFIDSWGMIFHFVFTQNFLFAMRDNSNEFGIFSAILLNAVVCRYQWWFCFAFFPSTDVVTWNLRSHKMTMIYWCVRKWWFPVEGFSRWTHFPIKWSYAQCRVYSIFAGHGWQRFFAEIQNYPLSLLTQRERTPLAIPVQAKIKYDDSNLQQTHRTRSCNPELCKLPLGLSLCFLLFANSQKMQKFIYRGSTQL